MKRVSKSTFTTKKEAENRPNASLAAAGIAWKELQPIHKTAAYHSS
jgi:hypothetical protein